MPEVSAAPTATTSSESGLVRALSEPDALTMSSIKVIEPGAGRTMPFLDGSTMSFLASGSDTHELVSFWEFTLPAGGQGPPPHIHHGHDELFYVVAGELTVHGADGDATVPSGSLVIVPRGSQHTFSNRTDAEMRMVGTFSPSRFEHYFEELAQEIDKHGGARPDPAVINRL